MFNIAKVCLFLSLFIVDVYAQDYSDIFEYHGRKNTFTNGRGNPYQRSSVGRGTKKTKRMLSTKAYH